MPIQDTKNLKLNEFPTVEVQGAGGRRLVVPCEIVAPGITITPYLELADDGYQLGGGFRLTHAATGFAFVAGQACIECARSVGKHLAALDVDWARVDPSDKATSTAALGDALPTVMKVLRRFQNCQQQVCAVGDDGELEECEDCGFTGAHAPYCIQAVVPMLFEHQQRSDTRPQATSDGGAR